MTPMETRWSRAARVWGARIRRRPLTFLLVAVVGVIAAIAVSARPHNAQAFSNYLTNAEGQYPGIVGTKLDSCLLCHTSATNPSAQNAYGSAYGAANHSFTAIEGADSDMDGFTNIAEITALTFPGNASDHPVAPTATATVPPPTATQPPPTATQPPPTATQPPPTATQPPATATSTVPGPTATSPAATATSTAQPPTATSPAATATSTVPGPTATSPEPTATRPGPAATSTEDDEPRATRPAPTATSTDDDEPRATRPAPTATSTGQPPTATATSETPPGTPGLDIRYFRVTGSVRLQREETEPVWISLTVMGTGGAGGHGTATVVGMQNGVQVYNVTINVTADGGRRGRYFFPNYKPTAAGQITWTATLDDGDPDNDTAVATTDVTAGRPPEDDRAGQSAVRLPDTSLAPTSPNQPAAQPDVSVAATSPDQPAAQPDVSVAATSPNQPAAQPDVSVAATSPDQPAAQPDVSVAATSPDQPAAQPNVSVAATSPNRPPALHNVTAGARSPNQATAPNGTVAATSANGACTGTHQVAPGENLFRIGFNCHFSIIQMAAANGIAYPYTIYPGQVLRYP